MSTRGWLAVSVVANVTLAILIVFGVMRRDQAPPVVAATRLLDELRTPGSSQQEKLLAVATLEAAARASLQPPHLEFWKSAPNGAEDAYQSQVEAQLDAMRRAVVRRYGASAVDDPMFVRLFKPLNGHFPYLSSKSQLALARLQRTRKVPSQELLRPAAVDPAAVYQREQEFNAAVRDVLTAAEYDEYQLRESPAARQLHSSAVEFNEQEFRDAFQALQQMDADRSAAGYLAGQEKLRGILGSQRFAQFSASRDPQFAALDAVAARHQLTRDQTLAAYAVMLDAQAELVRASVERDGGLARSGPAPQQVFEQRDQKVASLVGDDVGRELLEAYSNGVVAASLRAMNQAH